MLKCKDIHALSSDYVDRQLPWPRHLAFHVHLAICHHCRRFMRQFGLVRTVLRRLPPRPPGVDAQRIVAAALRSSPGENRS